MIRSSSYRKVFELDQRPTGMACFRHILLFAIVVLGLARETSQEIPLEFRKQLSAVNSTAEFINKFVRNKAQLRLTATPMRSDEFDPTTLTCSPRLTLVDIPADPDPNVVFYPSCVELFRCAGCCGDPRVACTPLSTRQKNKTVMKYIYSPDFNDLMFAGHATIIVEDHASCACNCIVTADECDNTLQTYDADACLCRCRDTTKANSCSQNKYWNSQQCRCACPELTVTSCFEDEVYDFSSCRCQLRAQVLPASDSENKKPTQ